MNGVSRIKRAEGLATDDFTWDGENRLVAVSKATPGTPYAYQGSLTSNGQGAISVSSYSTYAGPALKVGQVVTLSGAPLVQLNGAHAITSVWGSGSFSYQVPGTQSGGPVGVLVTVDQLNQQKSYQFGYDYRSRRVNLTTPTAPFTRVVFSGGTSVREIENGVATVDYVRGSDWGGGVGGILYTLRAGVPSFTHYNRRGDVTAKTDGTGKITYQAKYEAFGKRTSETGATLDRQKSNTKDEDIPGYANEGFRFRDLETGVFLSKDPLGFVDGPNLYAYVVQNPWTHFDPEGLKLDDLNLDGPAHFSASLDDSHNVDPVPKVSLDTKPDLSARNNSVEQQSNVDLGRGPLSPTASGLNQVPISDRSIQMIVNYEVDGGRSAYNKSYSHPTWPGGSSGVTIGIGYDLGFNTRSGFQSDWGSYLSGSDMSRLGGATGVKGGGAKGMIPGLRDITVPWDSAVGVFTQSTLPRFIAETQKAYPGVSALSPDAFGSMVSMTFNRGSGMGKAGTTDKRMELRAIRDAIASGNSSAVPDLMRASKRVWQGTDIQNGMYRRRDSEAALFEQGQ